MPPKAVDARKRFNRNHRFRGHGPLLHGHGPLLQDRPDSPTTDPTHA
jgi:hypothetical protein